MPLLDPPCFPGLVGCEPGYSPDGSVYIPPYDSSDGSSGFGDSGTGSNIIIGPRSGISSSLGSSGSDNNQYALYTVTLKNLGTKAVNGLQLRHGAVPFGSTFDPLKSSSSCSFLSPMIGCTESLAASATKKFPIVYKVTNSAHCRINPVLQTIRAEFSDPAAGSPPVSASVQCAIVKGSALDAELAKTKPLSSSSSSRSVVNTVSSSSSSRTGIGAGNSSASSRTGIGSVNSSASSRTGVSSVKSSTSSRTTVSTGNSSVSSRTGVGAGNSSSSSRTAASKDQYAVYTVSAKNNGTSPTNGAVLSHGAIPSGLSFDPSKSSPACSLSGNAVTCRQDLVSTETKKFPIVYKLTDGKKCEDVQGLKTISTPATISASVQCVSKNGDEIDQEIAKQNGDVASNMSSSIGNGSLFAVYDVTLKNLSNTPVDDIRAIHGTVPDDATFDDDKSDGSCAIGNSIVACKKNLGESATQNFTITYKVTDPEYCKNTPMLKTIAVQSASENAPIPPVSATVNCVMKTEDDLSFGNGIGGENRQENAEVIYDPNTVEPQTGANDLYYQNVGTDDYVLIPHDTVSIGSISTPIFFLSLFSIVILGYAMLMRFAHR